MLQTYLILRITSLPFKTKDHKGASIEMTEVAFSPIFSPIQAESPLEAFDLAAREYPNFRHVMAVQEQNAYLKQLADSDVLRLNTKSPSQRTRSNRGPARFPRSR